MKYLVELNSPDVAADIIIGEMEREFGPASESAADPEITQLWVDESKVNVLADYAENRLWIKIESPSSRSYAVTCQRIEVLLDRSKDQGHIDWSQIEI